MRKASQLLIFFLVLASSACTRYAIRSSESPRDGSVFIKVNEPISQVSVRLKAYLNSRSRLEQHINAFSPATKGAGDKEFFVQPWIRDSSLRYYLLIDDTRIRHLSEWKALWTLSALDKRWTKINLTVMEVIFLGPPKSAGLRPEEKSAPLKVSASEWFETNPDSMREIVELRRFWIENYVGKDLPPRIANFSVPTLTGPPLSKGSFSEKNAFRPSTKTF